MSYEKVSEYTGRPLEILISLSPEEIEANKTEEQFTALVDDYVRNAREVLLGELRLKAEKEAA